MSYWHQRPQTYTWEPSRVPAGVAMTMTSEELWLDCQGTAIHLALRIIAQAAREQHGEEMMPSTDPDDYTWWVKGSRTHICLKPDHPWWDGPVAHRVSKRFGEVTHNEWKLMHKFAAQYEIRVDQVVLEQHFNPDDYYPIAGSFRSSG